MMTKQQAAQLAETHTLVTKVATVLLGANGDTGLVGAVTETRGDVRAIKETLPLLTTKTECKEVRSACKGAGDWRYGRRKDLILGAFSGIGTCGGVLAVLKAFGKI